MSDLHKYIKKRKSLDKDFAENFDKGYEEFKINELKADRKIKELTVLNFWKEDNVIWDDEKQKLLDIELRDFASFVGIDDINWVCDKLN